MERAFLKNFQVNGAALPDAVIEAILAENTRDLEAAKAGTGEQDGNGGRTFTQEDVNRIVSDRLTRERESPANRQREEELHTREALLSCKEFLYEMHYPPELVNILDCSDAAKFQDHVKALAQMFPHILENPAIPDTPLKSPVGGRSPDYDEEEEQAGALAQAFKPKF